ncbi:acetyl esterase/lipase [Ruminococcaceae bacterium R-25]|nr:acetyl esterase/lipase [Ruminococcaceae bacterium R-25]SUQ22272.1 Acetyl esterase/lipase [Oscillospiraceae bacterium]
MFDSFVRYKAEKNRLNFIKNCTVFDTPRLENEVYPAECRTEMDIEYKHGQKPLKLDIYTPFNCYGAKECFILIHGGAYVYGFKRLDQNFGMHLAIKANIPVVNVDYTLMPDSDLSQIINEIFAAINFVCGRYGFKKIHTVGDSAGGFLAYIVAMATRSRHIRHGLWVFEKPRAIAESAGMICPGIENNPKEFPGYYFEKKPEGKSDQSRLPDYAYDLKLLAERDRDLRVCVIAGEDDFLLEQNLAFKELVPNAVFYEGKNDGELKCHHVFPIAHPEWPQSVKAIALLAENAVGRR